MLKLLKYMKKNAGYLILVFVLLFLQAYCELSLPSYTSDIVDIGIQQKGIPDAVPEQIRTSVMEELMSLMSESEANEVARVYVKDQDLYVQKEMNEKERDKVNEILGNAMLISQAMKEQNVDISTLPTEQKKQILDQAKTKIQEMSESIVTQTAISYVQQEYENQGLDTDKIQMNYILNSGLKMLGLALIAMAAAVTVTFLAGRIGAALGHDLRNAVYRKVISFSSAEMNRFSTASLITRSTNDITQVQNVTTMILRIVLYAPIIGIGGVMKVIHTGAHMTWILIVAVAAISALIAFLLIVAMPKFRILQTMIDKINQISREILTGIPVIRAFSTEKHEEQRFDKANRDLMKTNLFVNRAMTCMMPMMMIIMNGVSVLIVYTGAHQIDQGALQVGDMMAFIQYAMQIIMSFLMISSLSVMLPRAGVAASRINEVLDTEVSIHSPANFKRPQRDTKGLVEFRNVSFSYPGAEEQVLSNISFTAGKGETVAFIGSTGSGKSTLVNLIPRFFDVSEGEILVDGVNVKEMELSDLRERIGYVPQKAVLFSGTIESNLRFGAKHARIQEIDQAARIAQAKEFIDTREEGYASLIAQGGSNVSGGQKQRLSIARAVAKKPEIYIFDDSFSALDYKTDAALRAALKKETGDATTLIVAQRISTILHADRILVLDGGRIVGNGTHRELMNSCEVYRQIARSQLREEELEV
ncbi:MAG: ABC transporter ATP-binding protein [Lachnospiraceae bacterium]|nr:ABC transporter ATP-binding protein [Lachnospiraceae bacterium]